MGYGVRRRYGLHDFECGPFNRLGTSPNLCYIPGPDPPTNSAGGNREEQQDRTSNIIQFELGWNPHGSKGFDRLALRIGNLISSQPRYDHFDTAAFRSYHVGRRPLWSWVKNRIPDIAGEIKAHIKFFSGRSVGVPEI